MEGLWILSSPLQGELFAIREACLVFKALNLLGMTWLRIIMQRCPARIHKQDGDGNSDHFQSIGSIIYST